MVRKKERKDLKERYKESGMGGSEEGRTRGRGGRGAGDVGGRGLGAGGTGQGAVETQERGM